MTSLFDFVNEYPVFKKQHEHFLKAEEELYQCPQNTCLQVAIVLESFAKQLCADNALFLEKNAGGAKAIDILYNRNILNCELRQHAMTVFNHRNIAYHNDINDQTKAEECLKNGYLFCKKYIRLYLDPTIGIEYYRTPTQQEIRARKIEMLGITDTEELAKKLNEQTALCSSQKTVIDRQKDELAQTQAMIGQKDDVIFGLHRQIEEMGDALKMHQDNEQARLAYRQQMFASTDKKYLNDLNNEQKQAVLETEGRVRVIAGPGTGKTKTLVRRFVHLVLEKHIMPENILCLTFTNKAAKEMRSRIGEWLGVCDLSQVCTFHALCYRILVENAALLNIRNDFVILDEDDKTGLLEEICESMGVDISSGPYTIKKIKDTIEKWKKERYRSQYLKILFSFPSEQIEQIIQNCQDDFTEIFFRYIYEQRRSAALEFSDLMNATSYLFFQHPDIKEQWQRSIKYVMVDEYQDVDEAQARMCECLAEINHNLFVVGDPNQTIYSWRGANASLINRFAVTQPQKDIVLIENYRSSPEILAAAKNVISQQSAYCYNSNRPSGKEPIFYQARTKSEEAAWIVDKMIELSAGGVRRNEIAVLFRQSASSQRIELALLKKGLPYIVIGGNAFYNSKEIKTILSYLHLIVSDNDIAFKKVIGKPSRGIGAKTIRQLYEIQQQKQCSLFEALEKALRHKDVFVNESAKANAATFVSFIHDIRAELQTAPLSKIVSDVIEQSGYSRHLAENQNDDGLKNLIELLSAIQDKEKENRELGITNYSVDEYLKEVATYTASDNKERQNAFVLSTIHGVKGLEYRYVFICGLEENAFPLNYKSPKGTLANETEFLFEERRLCFVAITRATQGLFITNALSQHGADPSDRLVPSRFINEMRGNGIVAF